MREGNKTKHNNEREKVERKTDKGRDGGRMWRKKGRRGERREGGWEERDNEGQKAVCERWKGEKGEERREEEEKG